MTTLTSVLNSTVSFEAAALLVTWFAVVLVGLVAGNLQIRLQRLERALPTGNAEAPYSHLLGKSLQDLLGATAPATQPQVLIFLSSTCGACQRVLNELTSPSWTAPSAIIWTDRLVSPASTLPSNTIILDNGPSISAELGIRVTPFMVVANAEGRTVKASPINTLPPVNTLSDQTTTRELAH